MLDKQEIALLTKNSIASKAASKEILQNFQPFVANLDAQDAYSLLAKRGEDTLARSMLPDDFQQFLPLRSTADGNCLFNSTSIVLQGDEKLAGLLRLLVTCELIAHSEFYANHPQLKEMTSGEGAYKLQNLIVVLLSDETASKAYNGKADTVSDAINVLARVVSRPWVYATPYHMIALSSVIGRPVHSVYPDIVACARVRSSIHRKFLPRQMLLSEDDSFHMPPPVHIMWTTVLPEDLRTWKPNHFVPLVLSKEQSSGGKRVPLSYADAVKGQITNRPVKGSQDKKMGDQKGKISPFIKSEKVTGKEKDKDKDDEAEELKEPHIKATPEKHQSPLEQQSKLLPPNKVPGSFPCQIGESIPLEKSTKQKGNARDEAEEQSSGGKRVPLSYAEAVKKEKFSRFIRCEKVTEGKKEKGKNDKAEEQKEPHLKATPEKDQSPLDELRNGKSKPRQSNKEPESFPCQIGESIPLEKRTKPKESARHEAKLATPLKEVSGEDANRKDDKSKSLPLKRKTGGNKKDKPKSPVPPENSTPLIVKQISVTSKPMKPKKIVAAASYKIGKLDLAGKSTKTQGYGGDRARSAASTKKAAGEKGNYEKDKMEPPNGETKAKRKKTPHSTVRLEKDEIPPKEGESSLASELWQLKRKRSQSHHHSNSNKKLKGDFESSLPSNTTEKKPIMFKSEIEDEPESEKTEEALDKATNSYDLGSYLYGLSSSSYKNPKRKYLSKRKPMSTTLAFDFNAYYNDKNDKQRESLSSRLASTGIQGYFAPEKAKQSVKPLSDKSSLPLSTSAEWYEKQGQLSKANAARSEKRRSCQTGELVVNKDTFSFLLGAQTKESLTDSISRLEQKVFGAVGKEEARLKGILEVARSLRDSFPLMKTQKAGEIYKGKISELEKTGNEKEPQTVRTSSSEIYSLLSKHLNIMHLKIKGTGFIMETKDEGPFRNFFEQMSDLLHCETFQTTLNRHIEKQIGTTYKTLLSYMDTERDKSAMKYILTKITSVKFASKMQNTTNKDSIRRSRDLIPSHLRKFSELREDIRKELGTRNLSKRQERYLMKRTLEAEKMKQIRVRNSERSGRKLKVEEFPDLVAIMEYEFGEGDHRERGGGGLESHSKLRNELLYRASDSKTKMKDAREAILALAPDDFTISLSSCFNYTQNFRKGTLEAKRHHEGRGVNACLSLHKAPDTAPIKEKVINIHWTSSNVNYVLDKASKDQNNYCVDSRDAKQVIRANTGHGGRTWRNIENPDHTFDTSRTNAVTPMTHLLVQTVETKRKLTINNNPRLQELFLSPSPRSDVVIHIKRTGKAITFLNLSHYEPETIFRSVNEFLFMITIPALDTCFRNPESGQFKEVLVSVVDNGIEKPRSPLVKMLLVRLRRLFGLKAVVHVSFAEYHSKRNPVERVHAAHTKELEKHGPFPIPNLNVDSDEHKKKMEEMREDVEDVLKQARFGGEFTTVTKGVGGEDNFVFDDMTNLHSFLSMTEDRKAKSGMQYELNKDSKISKELAQVWNVDTSITGSYADDYEIINNNFSCSHRTAWADKYTTVLFDEQSPSNFQWKQPIPDYVRWYLTGGEQHYMTFEERSLLPTGPWDEVEELFLPSKLLDLIHLVHPHVSETFHKDLAILAWCTEEDVKTYLVNKQEDTLKELESSLHLARWRNHDLFSKSKTALEEMCKKNNLGSDECKSKLVEKLCKKLHLNEPDEIEEFDGDLSVIPTQLKEICKLPAFKLKQYLHYYNISWTGSKEQLALRVLALRTGTTHVLFQRERDGLLEVIDIAEQALTAQKEVKILGSEFLTRQRAFSTPEGSGVSSQRPREAAGQPLNKKSEKLPVPDGTTLSKLENIFDNIKREIRLLNKDSAQKYDPYNLSAIRSDKGRVMVKWTEKDDNKGWKPGWYTAIIKKYIKVLDILEIEYVSEPGKVYKVHVKDSVEKGTLRLHVTTCGVADLYDQVTEIGASILIKWTKEEVKGSGWKAGWYNAEVQAFEPDTDEITIIYKREPTVVYTECVTQLISEGKVKKTK